MADQRIKGSNQEYGVALVQRDCGRLEQVWATARRVPELMNLRITEVEGLEEPWVFVVRMLDANNFIARSGRRIIT